MKPNFPQNLEKNIPKIEMLGATTSVLISFIIMHLGFKITLATVKLTMKKNLTAANCFFFRETGERCKVGVVVVSPTFLEHEVSLLTPNFRFLSTVFTSHLFSRMRSVFKNSTFFYSSPRFSHGIPYQASFFAHILTHSGPENS